MSDRPDHRDVGARFAGVPGASGVRFVLLADRIIECQLVVHILSQGSLEPLTAAILDALDRREQMTFDQLLEQISVANEDGRRVVYEIVHALHLTNDILIQEDVSGVIYLQRIGRRVKTELRVSTKTESICFVPSCRYIAGHVSALSVAKWQKYRRNHSDVPCWEPNWPSLYSEDAIRYAVEESYRERFKPNLGDVGGLNEYRNEVLQRRQLLPVRPRIVGVTVVETSVSDMVICHRCYLFPNHSSEGNDWNVMVRRFPSGGEQLTYTRFLQRQIKSDEFRQELLVRSKQFSLNFVP